MFLGNNEIKLENNNRGMPLNSQIYGNYKQLTFIKIKAL